MIGVEVFEVAAGVSTFLGLTAFLFALFVSYKSYKFKKRIKVILESPKDHLAKNVAEILYTVESDEKRLDALKELLEIERSHAQEVYSSIQEGFDSGTKISGKIVLKIPWVLNVTITVAPLVLVVFGAYVFMATFAADEQTEATHVYFEEATESVVEEYEYEEEPAYEEEYEYEEEYGDEDDEDNEDEE